MKKNMLFATSSIWAFGIKEQEAPVKPEKEIPSKPNPNPDPTKPKPGGNEPAKIDPTRIEEPQKTDPTRIDEPTPPNHPGPVKRSFGIECLA